VLLPRRESLSTWTFRSHGTRLSVVLLSTAAIKLTIIQPISPVSHYGPLAVEPYRTLVISAPIEEQNTPFLSYSAQPVQTEHDMTTGVRAAGSVSEVAL
jgi:hypothetical protein